jgi:hypothetical protein
LRADENLVGGVCLGELIMSSDTRCCKLYQSPEMAIAIISFIKGSRGTVAEQGHYHYGPLPLIRVVIVIIV